MTRSFPRPRFQKFSTLTLSISSALIAVACSGEGSALNEALAGEPPAQQQAPSQQTADPTPPTLFNPDSINRQGVVKPDPFPALTGANDIVGFRLLNWGDAAVSGGYFTFAQVFAEGDVPAGQTLAAVSGGSATPAQMDTLATYADGSVKHALITVQSPSLTADETADLVLARGDGADGPPLTVTGASASALDVELTLAFEGGGTTTLTLADVVAAAASPIPWMSGPFASEQVFKTQVGGTALTAQFAVRVYADSVTRVDVSLHNDDRQTGNSAAVTYDVTLTASGETVYAETGVVHHPFANWRKEAWVGAERPTLFPVYDISYLSASGAVSPYDTTNGVSGASIGSDVDRLFDENRTLFDTGLYEVYMPATGGRGDIGLHTKWTANYLASQDPAAFAVMMFQADAAGSVQWHFIDPDTGAPYSIDDNPSLELQARGDTGWSVDQAHQPAMTFIPYVVTGDYYLWEELRAQANYNFLSLPASNIYRNGSDGLLHEQQVRGFAWSLRTLSDAEFIAPDIDPMGDYFTDKLTINLDYVVNRYVITGDPGAQAAGELEGYVERYAFRPWMQDFLAMTLGQTALRGSVAAADFSLWTQGYASGRFISRDKGFDPRLGPVYTMDTKNSSGVAYNTWKDAFDANYLGADSSTFSGRDPNDLTIISGRPMEASSYAAYSRAATALQASATMSVEAIEAHGFLVSETQTDGMLNAFTNEATFAIAARLPDGTLLNTDHTVIATTGNNIVQGTEKSELLHGDFGTDEVYGDGGMDLVFGGWGNDTVDGGAGDDFVFGNEGDDRLSPGPGTDIAKGNAGADTFVFTSADTGDNRIEDFDQSENDALEISSAFGAGTVDDIIANTTDTPDGAVISLTGMTLTIKGQSQSTLSTARVTITDD